MNKIITAEDIKNKLKRKYFNTICYYLGEFIHEQKITDLDNIEFVKMYDFEEPKQVSKCIKIAHPSKTLKNKHPEIERVYTYAVLK